MVLGKAIAIGNRAFLYKGLTDEIKSHFLHKVPLAEPCFTIPPLVSFHNMCYHILTPL